MSHSTSDRFARVCTWAAWLAMTVLAFHLAWRFAFPFPFRDTLIWTPIWTGVEPLTPAWLWQTVGMHRLPLCKMLIGGLAPLVGPHYEAYAWLNVALLSATAAILLSAARRARGSARVTDAIFPLLLLHWGHWNVMLWEANTHFVMTSMCAIVVLCVAAVSVPAPGVRGAIAAGLCTAALPLCGTSGMSRFPPLALWLFCAGLAIVFTRGPRPRRSAGVIAAALGAVACLLAVLYLTGYHPVAGVMAHSTGLPALITALQFLGLGFGAVSPKPGMIRGCVMLVAVAAALAWLARIGFKRPQERIRAGGLAACLLSGLLIASVIGWGRAATGPGAGIVPRYMTVSSVTLCSLFMMFVVYARRRASRVLADACALAVAVLIGCNMAPSYRVSRQVHLKHLAIEREAQAGLPPGALAFRYWEELIRRSWRVLAGHLELLHTAGLPPYYPRPDLRDVQVSAMIPLHHGRPDPTRPLPLLDHIHWLEPGQSASQRFRAEPPRSLFRIDVQLWTGWVVRTDPPYERIAWQLSVIPAGGATQPLREGVATHADFAAGGDLVVTFEPLSISQPGDLELVLRNDSQQGSFGIPYYAQSTDRTALAAGPAWKGYLFFGEPEPDPSP